MDSVGDNWVVNRTGKDWAHQQPKAYTLEKIILLFSISLVGNLYHFQKYCTSSISEL